MPPAALVNTMRAHAQAAQHPDAECHLLRRVAFVQVGAAGHHRDIGSRRVCRNQLAGVTHGGRSRPAGDLGIGDLDASVSSSAKAPRPLPSTTATRGRSVRALFDDTPALSLNHSKHSRDARRHEIRHRAGGHGLQSQPRQIRLAASGASAPMPPI